MTPPLYAAACRHCKELDRRHDTVKREKALHWALVHEQQNPGHKVNVWMKTMTLVRGEE